MSVTVVVKMQHIVRRFAMVRTAHLGEAAHMRRLRRSPQPPAAPVTTERAWYVQPVAGATAIIRAERVADVVAADQKVA
ncbi:MAG TPA: hypothetical protein VEA78_02260 [Acidimicrobiales bacterium]|nr:hypothetical protein [Acidimicrobiales bacterium]